MIAYVAAVFALERRWVWLALAYPAAGIFLGLVINPYYPQNLVFIGRHILPKLGDVAAVPVGREWYPYDGWALLSNGGLSLALVFVAILGLRFWPKKLEVRELTALILAAVFAGMLLYARRFIEYFPPFALIVAALVLDRRRLEIRRLTSHLNIARALLIAAVMVAGFWTLYDARAAMRQSSPADRFAAAALWLSAYGGPGSVIFQTDWDDFSRLFFYHGRGIYTVGLDPSFMHLHNRELYEEWVALTRGEIARPSTIIRDKFGAAYVYSDLDHDQFLERATQDSNLREIYRDEDAVIFAVASNG